jgi:hypothetical protein
VLAERDGPPKKNFDVVIVATGFGKEVLFKHAHSQSYWYPDATDTVILSDKKELLVSGVGDGGLIDLFRLIHSTSTAVNWPPGLRA